jgi:hypothetical protein
MSGIIGQVGARSGIVGSTTDGTQLDYEEGTFTITLDAGTVTTGSSVGKYIKIGKLVTVYGQFEIDTGTTASFVINSLPFTSESAVSNNANNTVGAVRNVNGNISTTNEGMITVNFQGTDNLYFQYNRDDAAPTNLDATASASYAFTHTYEAT